MKHAKISVVIPVYNAVSELKACVDSLASTASGLYELIIVDNASGAATRRYLSGLQGVVMVRNSSNLGFAKAVNQGIKKASGRYIAVVNSDVVFFHGGLQGLAACLDSDASIGAVGPLTDGTCGAQLVKLPRRTAVSARALSAFAQTMLLRFPGHYLEVHRLVGFCFMLRREAVESVGLLDERFGIGCYEDYDYSLRLRQAGWRLKIAKDVFVRHAHHASFNSLKHVFSWVHKNREVFVDKWCRKALEFLDELDPELAMPLPRGRRRG